MYLLDCNKSLLEYKIDLRNLDEIFFLSQTFS